MEEREVTERPESLPQQVTRLVATFGRAARRTRARWIPWACLALCPAIKFGLPLGYGFLEPWYLLLFLGGVRQVGIPLAGLGVALTTARGLVRWGIGLVIVALLADGFGEEVYSLLNLGSGLFYWALWIAIGLTVRAVRRATFGHVWAPRGQRGILVGDLLMLTAVVAVSFGMTRVAYTEAHVALAPLDFNVWAFAAFAVALSVAPLLPLLFAIFPLGSVRIGWVIATFLLTVIGKLLASNVLVIGPVSVWGGIDDWFFYALITMIPAALGEAAGVVVIALALRWAGYRLQRVGCATLR